jgi:hypothetical protein
MKRYAKGKSRYGAGKKKNKSKMTGMASKMMNVFKYPFSTTTLSCKIPDGSCTLSSGQRFHTSAVLTAGNTGVGWIALLPSFNNGFLYSTGLTNATTAATNAAAGIVTAAAVAANATVGIDPVPGNVGGDAPLVGWSAVQYPGQFPDITYGAAPADHFGGGPASPATMAARLAKWRIVSTALKINLINSSEFNDGYFEAIRISMGVENDAHDEDALRTELNAAVTNNNTQMIDQPSYVTGKLKDIHKFVFQSRPDGLNHDFNSNTDTLDNGFDCVLIRITGRTVAGADTNVTKLMCHVVSNQEIVYKSTYALSRFHTESYYLPNFQAKAAARWVDVKAAYRSLQS